MVTVAFKPGLDMDLAIRSRKVRLPGNWQLTNDSATWEDYEVGKTDAFRTIRYDGRRYWVVAQRTQVDAAAALIGNILAFGALGLLASSDKPEYFTTLQLYSTDPRHDRSGWDATLGGGTIKRTLQRRADFKKQLGRLRTQG